MTLNRRDFIRAGGLAAAAGACAHLTGCKRNAATTSAVRRVQFEFSGLFAFELYSKNAKKMRVQLVDGAKAGLYDRHAPLMITAWEDFDSTKVGKDYYAPQPLHLAGKKLAMWSLDMHRVWVHEVHPTGYDTDRGTNLTFPARLKGLDHPPKTPTDNDWSDLHWYPDLQQVIKSETALTVDRDLVSASILLTRGTAAGREPDYACDKEPKYGFRYKGVDPTDFRAFGNQIYAEHPATGPQLELKVQEMVDGRTRSILLNVPEGGTTPVTIVNSPIGHGDLGHFKAFLKLVKYAGDDIELYLDPSSCGRAGFKLRDLRSQQDQPAPPFEGCIPPEIPDPQE